MRTRRVWCYFLLLLTIVGLLEDSALAYGDSLYSSGNEIAIPDDLDFSVNDTCSGHLTFQEADAREDGMFIVVAHHYVSGEHTEDTFIKKYIDIYSSDGTFLQELTFRTEFAFSTALTEDEIVLYFYDYALVYDLQTQELKAYSTPKGDSQKNLFQKSFTRGTWTYQCEGSAGNYWRFVRSNGTEEQVLVELSGNVYSSGLTLPLAIAMAVVALCLWVQFGLRKRRKKRQ